MPLKIEDGGGGVKAEVQHVNGYFGLDFFDQFVVDHPECSKAEDFESAVSKSAFDVSQGLWCHGRQIHALGQKLPH